ncbi:MAG TPA: hypothetical protein DCF63_18545 [Planctomycetaceae bacterium]|nr:hypothetical protein [Planctomycetaceae bacterium]
MNSRAIATRAGFTLLELVLALALIVVATALIGAVMNLYSQSFSSRGADIRQKQLARSILTMIAQDIRSVVTEQAFDASALSQAYAPGTYDPSQPAGQSPTPDPTDGDPAASDTVSPTSDLTSLSSTLQSTLPPGIYASQGQLVVDISRVPRADQYQVQMAALGTMTDLPADVKRVTYYVQAATPLGVQDALSQVATVSTHKSSGYASGLVRRELDRSISSFAEENGLSNQLMTTGQLIAPEVVSLEFTFFDGSQWVNQWDSMQQGLPALINITLALQSAADSQAGALQAGASLSALSSDQINAAGITVYELTVAIPGSQLQSLGGVSIDSADMESLGL